MLFLDFNLHFLVTSEFGHLFSYIHFNTVCLFYVRTQVLCQVVVSTWCPT